MTLPSDTPKPRAAILLADDEESVVKLFRGILEGDRYQVTTARDGEEVLRLLSGIRFDLVIIDLVMPHREGIETILAICREYPDLKIIAVSGAAEFYLEAAAALGANATLRKPVAPEQLLAAVREVLK